MLHPPHQQLQLHYQRPADPANYMSSPLWHGFYEWLYTPDDKERMEFLLESLGRYLCRRYQMIKVMNVVFATEVTEYINFTTETFNNTLWMKNCRNFNESIGKAGKRSKKVFLRQN